MEWTGFGSYVFFPKECPGCQAVKIELAAHGSDVCLRKGRVGGAGCKQSYAHD